MGYNLSRVLHTSPKIWLPQISFPFDQDSHLLSFGENGEKIFLVRYFLLDSSLYLGLESTQECHLDPRLLVFNRTA